MSVFDGARAGGADYLDMAMSLSRPRPEEPYAETGVKLGDERLEGDATPDLDPGQAPGPTAAG